VRKKIDEAYGWCATPCALLFDPDRGLTMKGKNYANVGCLYTGKLRWFLKI
jgi:hypothetical protein